MSYRDKTTISFEGASLWMLAGGNGAGKSTVFDAMRWTLFGAHRGGRSGHEALIHRDRERLRVAFDLALGDERFRLLRTLSRTGRATWQIEKSNGGNFEKIPETDGRDGYESWLREHIGLSDETFCAAMYLAQGRGDAILSASPTQRYEMLREIVDISAFAALHERAKTRAAEWEQSAKNSERDWQNAPGASGESIEVLGEKLRELSAQITRNAARREEVLRLEPLAAQWQELQSQQEIARKSLDEMRENLRDAPQIECDFARCLELETQVPALEKYVQIRERIAENARDIQQQRALLHPTREKLARLTLALGNAQTERGEIESEQKLREVARLDALFRQGEMAPQLADARQIALYEAEIAGLEAELAAFSTDLATRIEALQLAIENAQEQKIAADILRRFMREKSAFEREIELQNAVQKEISRLETTIPTTKNEAKQSLRSLETARETQTRSLQGWSAAKTRRLDCEAALQRFEEISGQANCYFCGQILTPEHAKMEAERLQNALESTKNQEASAQTLLENQNIALESAENALQSAQNTLEKLEKELEKLRGQEQNSQLSARNARANATETLRELSADFAAFFDGNASPDWDEARVDVALNHGFPSLFDFETLQNAAQKLESWRTEGRDLQNEETARREIASRTSDRKNQLAPLRALLKSAAVTELWERETALQIRLRELVISLENGAFQVQSARDAVVVLEKSRADVQLEIARAQSQIAALQAAKNEMALAVEDSDSSILAAFSSFDDARLGAELSRLQNEFSDFNREDLRARAAALTRARAQISEGARELSRLEIALKNVPHNARQAPQTLQNEARNLQLDLESDDAERREIQLEKSELERRRNAKKELEIALLESQNAARQHKTLAELLGPHQLQRYLLREAENGILDEANAVLDRISSGTLRLELRAADDEIAGARKTAPKVLDIAVFRADDIPNSAARNAGMLPAFLSGSQRFRVAVAVALGIGRYATRGGGTRLEAVIIDEGFGSLDKIGRGEMIDELKMLGQELKRVILVSHQEEFADAFPNRYLIENDGETSTAHLMVN